MQITITNQSGNHSNQYPVCNYWKYCSVLRFSKRNVENYWSVTRCHLKSAMLSGSWEQQSYPGATIKLKGDRVLLRIMRRKSFLSAFRIRVELIRRTGRRVLVCTVQGRLVAAGSLKTSGPMPKTDFWPSLSPPYVGRHPPKRQPSALISGHIRWWVQGQLLPLWWSC